MFLSAFARRWLPNAGGVFAATLLVAFPLFAAPAGSTPPRPIQTVSPAYPSDSSVSGKNGNAMIDVLVQADGTVAEARVKSADDEAFGTAALAAIQQWRFEPATVDGKPVARRVAVPFRFIAPFREQVNAHFQRKVFQTIDAPVLTEKQWGKKLKATKKMRTDITVPPKMPTGSVRVHYVVAPDGTTINPEIVGTAPKELVVAALTAVANAAYEPPLKDGKGVYVEATAKLTFAAPEPRRGRRGGGDFGDFGGGMGGGGMGGGFPDN